VVPGSYTMTVIVRNRVLHKFTLAEFDLRVEELSPDRPALTDVVPGFSTELVEKGPGSQQPSTFQVGGVRIHPASDAVFSIGDSLFAFFQVWEASPEHQLQFTLSGEGRTIEERSTRVSTYRGGPVIERFDLRGIAGGRYELGVRLLDPGGDVVAEKATQLNVTPRTGVPRPGYVAAFTFNAALPGMVKQALGEQFHHLKRYQDARRVLKEAVAANGDLPAARWLLAEAHNQLNEPERALAILQPMEADHGDRYEVLYGLGFAHSLENDSATAAGYLERAMTIRPPSASHLNLLSDCYRKLGDLERARQMLERSLELVPDQPTIQQELERLRR
jgi:tetratricopeptide (TPR) repeat protein